MNARSYPFDAGTWWPSRSLEQFGLAVKLAEGQGFEPWNPDWDLFLSKEALSTAQPALQ